jgi:Domain of unknown function (DUF1835)
MLHITNGDVAAALLRERGVPGDVLVWRDVLHEGPVTHGDDRAALARERAAFLAAAGWGDALELAREMERRDERVLRAAGEGEPITLWFEDDLFDQLQLVQVLVTVGEHAPLELVELPRPPRALAPDPEAEALDEQHVALARRAWAAFTAGDVDALFGLAGEREAPLAHLPLALGRLLEELPWTRDGLSRVERAALRAVAAGARDREATFAAVAEQEERPFLGDAWLFARLDALAPLLGGEGLSAFGADVLAGRADWLGDGAVDRWLGGLRLRSPGPAWRWDAEHGAPVAP